IGPVGRRFVGPVRLVQSDGPIGRSEEASDARTGTDRTYSRERDSLSKTNKTTRRLLRQQ
ncbi:MAG: hypothetical protein ACK53Y_00760, partial [bacterium]